MRLTRRSPWGCFWSLLKRLPGFYAVHRGRLGRRESVYLTARLIPDCVRNYLAHMAAYPDRKVRG